MCFSAKASFTAAAVIGVLGIFTVRKAKSSSQIFLAVIPLLFALQQFWEGVLWLSLDKLDWAEYQPLAKYSYLTLAFIVWPTWIPLSMLSLETDSQRKNWLYFLLLAGIFYSLWMLFNLGYRWPSESITVHIVDNSIQYGLPFASSIVYSLFYCVAILLPPFVSTYPRMWIFGILNAVGLALAYFFYFVTLESVWCFFAALISAVILYII